MSVKTKRLVLLAVFVALAYACSLYIRIPAMPVPPFLKYEPKDAILTLAGFIMGPLAALSAAVAAALLELSISEHGIFGLLMNIVSSGAFCCTAAVVYRYKRTIWGAVLGLSAGWLFTVVVMMLWNFLIVPLYMPHVSHSQAAAMLIPVFLPFNALKYGLSAGLAALLYKPVKRMLVRTNFLPASATVAQGKISMALLLAASFLIAACALFILLWNGIL